MYKHASLNPITACTGVYGGMGSEDNWSTFTYVASQLKAFNLAYIHVMDGFGACVRVYACLYGLMCMYTCAQTRVWPRAMCWCTHIRRKGPPLCYLII